MRPPFKPSSLAELYDQLESHDWHYSMSDDQRVYLAGQRNHEQLRADATAIPGGTDLLAAFSRHVFSGDPWGTIEAPKPPRPLCVASQQASCAFGADKPGT